jgi:hypothetical protein
MDGAELTEGGIIGNGIRSAVLVGFRMPDSGEMLPLEVHYPDGRVHYVTCRRCADSGRIGPDVPCPACVQPRD